MSIFSKTTTYDPMSAYSPEQQESIRALQSLAATGTGGGITLGESYGGQLGAYDITEQSQSGLTALQNLLAGAYDQSSDIGRARSVYQNLANNSIFDLESDESGYKAFNRALTKAGKESASVLDREAAITGSRFGTGIQAQKADLAENLQLQRQQAIANLFQNSQAMAQAGAQGLTGLANQIGQLSGMNITYGDMQRELQGAKAKDAYNEFKRTRAEELDRIGLMQQQWQTPMGVIETKGPSMLAKMWGTINPIVGSYNQQRYGYQNGQITIDKVINAAISGMKSSAGGGAPTGGA